MRLITVVVGGVDSPKTKPKNYSGSAVEDW